MKMRLALVLASSLFLSLGCTPEPGPEADTSQTPDTTPSDVAPTDTGTDVAPKDTADSSDADVSEVTPDTDTSTPPTSMWELRALGDEGALTALFALPTGPAYAVGKRRVIVHTGKYWIAYGDPSTEDLNGVWADDAGVVVVGNNGTIARRASGAMEWVIDEVPTTEHLRAVYGRAQDDIWAVGDKTTILHYDGTAWTQVYSGSTTALHGLWIRPDTTGADGVLAVGSGGRLLRKSGETWVSEQVAKSDVVLKGIWGDDDTLVAIGSGGTITMKTAAAGNWKGQASNDPSSRDLHAVAGTQLEGLLLVGGQGTIIKHEGGKWNIQPATGPNLLGSDLVGVGYVNDAWTAVAATGGGLAQNEDGAWVDTSTQPSADVNDIAAANGKLWMVGDDGLIVVETASGWTRFDSGTSRDLFSAAAGANDTLWVSGSGGTVLRIDADNSVSKVSTGVPVALFGIATSGDDVAVCGKGGTLMRLDLDTQKFKPTLSGTPNELRACAWDSSGTLWLAGSFGTLITVDADGNTAFVSSEVGSSFNTMVAGEEGVYVAGDNGIVIHATADKVTRLADMPGIFLYGVSASAGSAFAAGWNGTILKLSGDAFVPEDSGTNVVLEAIWHDETRAIAAGRQGIMLVRTEAP